MRRGAAPPIETGGQDSFLDIVANMVGILIILVMVVGVRAGKAVLTAPVASIPAPAADEQLAAARSQAVSLESEILDLHRQSQHVQQTVNERRAQQEQLATLIKAIEAEMAERRAALSGENQQEFDLQRNLAAARRQLEQLDQAQIALEHATPNKIEVQSLPTPISKTVHGKEVHFQLREGRVAFIPLDELLKQFKEEAPHKIWKLQSQPELVDSVGPLDGFRLRYTLEQEGPIVRLSHWELMPVETQMGETVEEALAPNSRFQAALGRINRRNSTLTIWTYPESFAEFRKLKAELHALSYATAGRPLPAGQPIGGSPEGSRTAAQ